MLRVSTLEVSFSRQTGCRVLPPDGVLFSRDFKTGGAPEFREFSSADLRRWLRWVVSPLACGWIIHRSLHRSLDSPRPQLLRSHSTAYCRPIGARDASLSQWLELSCGGRFLKGGSNELETSYDGSSLHSQKGGLNAWPVEHYAAFPFDKRNAPVFSPCPQSPP